MKNLSAILVLFLLNSNFLFSQNISCDTIQSITGYYPCEGTINIADTSQVDSVAYRMIITIQSDDHVNIYYNNKKVAHDTVNQTYDEDCIINLCCRKHIYFKIPIEEYLKTDKTIQIDLYNDEHCMTSSFKVWDNINSLVISLDYPILESNVDFSMIDSAPVPDDVEVEVDFGNPYLNITFHSY